MLLPESTIENLIDARSIGGETPALQRKINRVTLELEKAIVRAKGCLKRHFEPPRETSGRLTYLDPELLFLSLDYLGAAHVLNVVVAIPSLQRRFARTTRSISPKTKLSHLNAANDIMAHVTSIDDSVNAAKNVRYYTGDIAEFLAFLRNSATELESGGQFDYATDKLRAIRYGDVDAMFRLGLREADEVAKYFDGGILRRKAKGFDLKRAASWFRKAELATTAEPCLSLNNSCNTEGHLQYAMWGCFTFGLGVPRRSSARGARRLRSSARRGFGPARAALLYQNVAALQQHMHWILVRKRKCVHARLAATSITLRELCVKKCTTSSHPWHSLCASSVGKRALAALFDAMYSAQEFNIIETHHTTWRHGIFAVEHVAAIGVASILLQKLRDLVCRRGESTRESLSLSSANNLGVLRSALETYDNLKATKVISIRDMPGLTFLEEEDLRRPNDRERANVRRAVRLLASKFGVMKTAGWEWLRTHFEQEMGFQSIPVELTWDFETLLDRLFELRGERHQLHEKQGFDTLFIGFGFLRTYSDFFNFNLSLSHFSNFASSLKSKIDDDAVLRERITSEYCNIPPPRTSLGQPRKREGSKSSESGAKYDDDFIENVIKPAVGNNPFGLAHLSPKLRSNFDVVLKAVQTSGNTLQYASRELKGDRDIVLAAVSNHGEALKYANEEVRGDEIVVVEAIKQTGGVDVLRLASTELRSDPNFMFEAFLRHPEALRYCAMSLADNVDFMKEVVATNWRYLDGAPEHICGNKEICLQAILEQDWRALKLVSTSVARDPTVVTAAIRSGGGDEVLNFVPPEVLEDADFMLHCVKERESSLKHASMTLRSSGDFVMAALRSTRSPRVLKFCSLLTENYQFMLNVIDEFPEALQFCSEELRANRQLVLTAMVKDGRTLKFAGEALKHDRQVISCALGTSGLALQFCPWDARDDKILVLKAVRQNGLSLVYASTSLQADKDISIEAMKQNGRALQYTALNGDIDVVREAHQQAGDQVLCMAAGDVAADFRLVLSVKRDGMNLRFCPWKMRENKALVHEAVSFDGLALRHASTYLRANFDVVIAAVMQNGRALQFASTELQADEVIVEAAFLGAGTGIFKFISDVSLAQAYRKREESATLLQKRFRILSAAKKTSEKRRIFQAACLVQAQVRRRISVQRANLLRRRNASSRRGYKISTGEFVLLRAIGEDVTEAWHVSRGEHVPPTSRMRLAMAPQRSKRRVERLPSGGFSLVREDAYGNILEVFNMSSTMAPLPTSKRRAERLASGELALIREDENGGILEVFDVSNGAIMGATAEDFFKF